METLVCADDLGELLLGECKLQTYLKENPLKQGASPRGPRPKLVEVRKHLTAALDRGNLKVCQREATEGILVLLIWHCLLKGCFLSDRLIISRRPAC